MASKYNISEKTKYGEMKEDEEKKEKEEAKEDDEIEEKREVADDFEIANLNDCGLFAANVDDAGNSSSSSPSNRSDSSSSSISSLVCGNLTAFKENELVGKTKNNDGKLSPLEIANQRWWNTVVAGWRGRDE